MLTARFADRVHLLILPVRLDEIDDGLLFFYGGVLLLIVHAKHNRAELLNSNTASKRSTRTPSAKSIPACALSLQSICQDTLHGHFEPVA